MKARFVYENGISELREISTKTENGITKAYLPKDTVGEGVSYIDFMCDVFTAKTGDDGYFITNHGTLGTFLTRFVEKEDTEIVRDHSFIACFGFNKGKSGLFAIVTGMRCDFGMVLGVKDGVYYTYPRFYIDGDAMYEDIEVELYELEDGSYSAMARLYREFQLTRCGCVPLKERAASEPRIKNAVDGIEVRVRQGWKPAPSPVEYQTPETEPPMHV